MDTAIKVADDRSFAEVPARQGMRVMAYRTSNGSIVLVTYGADGRVQSLANVTPEAFRALTAIGIEDDRAGTLTSIQSALPDGVSDEDRDRLLTKFRDARVQWYRFGRDDEREGRPEPW